MKNSIVLNFLTLLFLSLNSSAQVTTKFQVYNAFIHNASFAPITDTYDGGHLLQYSYNYSGNRDDSTVLIKTDGNFVPIWRKVFGTYLNDKRALTFPDGNSIIFARASCWNVQDTHGQYSWFCPRFILHKLNNLGQTIWSKEIGSTSNNDYITPYDAFLKNNSTIKIGGRKGSQTQSPVIMNFDLDGNLLNGTILQGLWGTVYSMSKEESTGNYYALISSNLCKFDQNDTLLWAREIKFQNLATYFSDYPPSAANTITLNNGDLLVSCFLSYVNSSFGRLLIRIDTNGNLVWAKKIICDSIGGLKELASGEIVISMIDESYINYMRINYVIKITANGNLVWAKGYRNSSSVSGLYEKNANEWVFAVHGFDRNQSDISYHQPTVFSTDNSGNSACNGFDANITMTNANITLSVPASAITQTPLVTLQSIPDSTPYLITVESQNSTTECTPLSIADFNSNETYLYPNPNTGNFSIKSNDLIEKVEIFTLLGQKITKIIPAKLEFSASIEQPGIYIVRISTTYGCKVVKVIVAK